MSTISSSSTFKHSNISLPSPLSLSLHSSNFLPIFHHPIKPLLSISHRKPIITTAIVFCKPPEESEEHSSTTQEEEEEDEWLQKLPEKTKPLYSHSLPCIEAWLRSLGFQQSKDDRAVWLVHKPDWHAHLSLDITDLYIRCVFSFFLSFSYGCFLSLLCCGVLALLVFEFSV